MSFAKGSIPRVFGAALLAPVAPLFLLLLLLAQLSVLAPHRAAGAGPPWSTALAAWLALSAAIATGGLILRALKRTRLRHHLLFALALAAVPAIITLAKFIYLMPFAIDTPELPEDGALDLLQPYPCADYFRAQPDLDSSITLALWVPTAAMAFKWLTYGFDKGFPVSAGWKIAAAVYLFALLADFLILSSGQITGAHSGWTDLASKISGCSR